eukprot:5859830-Amphidinium_carterae.2
MEPVLPAIEPGPAYFGLYFSSLRALTNVQQSCVLHWEWMVIHIAGLDKMVLKAKQPKPHIAVDQCFCACWCCSDCVLEWKLPKSSSQRQPRRAVGSDRSCAVGATSIL